MSDRIEEIKARRALAREGTWEYDQYAELVITHGGTMVDTVCDLGGLEMRDKDGFFISYAKEDIDYLLAEVARLQAERDRLDKIICLVEQDLNINLHDGVPGDLPF